MTNQSEHGTLMLSTMSCSRREKEQRTDEIQIQHDVIVKKLILFQWIVYCEFFTFFDVAFSKHSQTQVALHTPLRDMTIRIA